jgi:hypothetical protein
MKTTNSRMNPIAIKEMANRFENDVAKADAVRASALTGLQRLRAARANHIQREQERLARDLGDKHPDVLRLKAEWTSDQRFMRNLGVQIDRAQAIPPTVDGRDWILHGYVRNQNLESQPNLTVALFDRGGRWVKGLGHTCTDARGYFQLRYSTAGEAAAREEPKTVSDATQPKLFIRVSNQKQEVLYRDKAPMSAAPGEVKYREIILGGESASCPPPSEALSEESSSARKSSAKAPKPRKARSTKKGPREKK